MTHLAFCQLDVHAMHWVYAHLHFLADPCTSMHHRPDVITCVQVYRRSCTMLSVSNSLKQPAWLLYSSRFWRNCICVYGAAISLTVDMQTEGARAAGAASGRGGGCHQGDPIWPHPQPPSTPLPLPLPVTFTHPCGRRWWGLAGKPWYGTVILSGLPF